MASVDLLYYLAGLFMILVARSHSIVEMRIYHILGSALFVAYGVLVEIWPIIILNGTVGLLHILRILIQQLRLRLT